MPLPNGVTTFTLTGDELDATGAAGIPGTRGTLTPVDSTGNPVRIVHLATGAEIVPAGVTFTIAADGTWTVGPLPYTDQSGLSVVGFQYRVTWNVPAWRASPGDKTFSVPSGTASPVPYSSLGPASTVPTVLVPAVPSVVSVNGKTGAVTLAASDVGALPPRYARLVQAVIGLNNYSGIPAAIDGVVPSPGDIVLLTAEAASVNNGLWTVQAGPWTRPAGFVGGSSVIGAVVTVYDGNSHPGSVWVQQGTGKVVGTDGLSFTEYRKGTDRGAINAFSLYYPGDIVTTAGTRVLITSPTQASGSATLSAGTYAVLQYLQGVDIRAFGAKVDGLTDDTAAIQAAINSFGTQGASLRGTGGMVSFPVGTTRISATLDLPSNVHLRGAGWAASVIQLLPNSNCDMIRFHKSTGGGNSNAFWASVQDLMLDGRYVPGGQQLQGTTVTDVTLGAAGTTTISSAGQHTFTVGEVVLGIGVMPGTTISAVGTPATSATLSRPLLNTVAQNGGGVAGSQAVLIGGDPTGRPWAAIYHETNPYNTLQSGDNQFDPTHLIRNVWIYAFPGDGVRVKGRSDLLIDHVKVSFAQSCAFHIDFDTAVANSMAEQPVGHGVWLDGHSSNRITDCKIYNSYGYGVYGTGGGTVGEMALTGLDIQQTNSHGIYLQNYAAPVSVQGCTVGQAGFSNAAQTVASGQDIAAVVLDNVSYALVDVACLGDAVALKVVNSSAKNDVRITHSSTVSGARDLSANNQASLGSNRVVINGTVVNPAPALANLTTDVNISSPLDGQVLTYQNSSGKWINGAGGGGGSSVYGNLFGDGSDGVLTLDGVTAATAGMGLSSNTYTMTRDVFATQIAVSSGVTLKPNGFRIYCIGTVTNGGTIQANGGSGQATGTAGTAVNGSATLASSAGGAGNTGAGAAGPGVGSRVGMGNGGAGGAGSGGAGGATGFSASSGNYMLRLPQVAVTGALGFIGSVSQLSGGPGGGGGGGDATNKGGGGGAGGGVVAILAHIVTNTGTLSAVGGTGGTPATGNCGGGGGGAGGLLLLYTLQAWSNTGTATAAGGSGGSGVGTGVAGGNGSAGSVLNFVLT